MPDLHAHSLMCPKASGAEAHSLHSTIDLQPVSMDIREPPRVGPALGMADVVAKLAALITNPALGHEISSLTA